MSGSRPRWTLGLFFILLLGPSLIAVAPSAAQVPEVHAATYGINLIPDRGSVYVPYLRNQLVNITLDDISSVRSPATFTPTQFQVLLTAEVLGGDNQTKGWIAALEASAVYSQPGQTQEITLNIQAGATLIDPVVTVRVSATYLGPGDQRPTVNTTILAVAQPRAFVYMQLPGQPPSFTPDEQKPITLTVRNDNYYPDMVTFTVQPPPGWTVSPPSTVTLGPGETREVVFDVKAPQDPWFLLYPSGEVILVTAQSASDPGAKYSTSIPASISGSFLPGWVIPHILLFILGAIAMVRVVAVRRRERSCEKGKPDKGHVTPEQEARLAALQKSDPQRAEAMEERMAALHQRRKEAWREQYKKRKDLEKRLAEREKARHDALVAAQKQESKEERREEKRRRKKLKRLETGKKRELRKARKKKRKAEKAAAKARRKEEKRALKGHKKKQKKTAKKVKKLRKRQQREEKKAAKRRAKEAKAREREIEKLKKRKAKLEKRERKAEKGSRFSLRRGDKD